MPQSSHVEQLLLECGNVSLKTFFLKKEHLETELNIHMELNNLYCCLPYEYTDNWLMGYKQPAT